MFVVIVCLVVVTAAVVGVVGIALGELDQPATTITTDDRAKPGPQTVEIAPEPLPDAAPELTPETPIDATIENTAVVAETPLEEPRPMPPPPAPEPAQPEPIAPGPSAPLPSAIALGRFAGERPPLLEEPAPVAAPPEADRLFPSFDPPPRVELPPRVDVSTAPVMTATRTARDRLVAVDIGPWRRVRSLMTLVTILALVGSLVAAVIGAGLYAAGTALHNAVR